MAGFPSLEPAFIAQLTFDPPKTVGNLSRGGQAHIAHINGGTFVSQPGYDHAVDAVFEFGSDHFLVEPDFQTVRIDVKACLRNKDDSIISYQYLGVIRVDDSYRPIIAGSPDAKTTDFGSTCEFIFTHPFTLYKVLAHRMTVTHVTLESGSDGLKELQRRKFVGCSRFIVEQGKPLVIEQRISEVVYRS